MKVTLESHTKGCIIRVRDKTFKDDLAITLEEAKLLYPLLKKYIEKNTIEISRKINSVTRQKRDTKTVKRSSNTKR